MDEICLHEYCEQIKDVIEQGRYEEALAHGRHILKHYPKHATTYWLLGKAMLQAGQDEHAADMFRRVLSADPEDMLAWVGMSEVYDQRGELEAAVWYLERAFELASGSEMVREELGRLYSRLYETESERVQLTRGALARLYLRSDLLSRAVGELRALLAEHPERVDLSTALAEALWRNGQRLEATEVCERVLNTVPYCLKANLILGEIWSSSGAENGEMYLERAEAVDPENQMAQELFGSASPLPAQEARIAPLEYAPAAWEKPAAWVAEMEGVSAEAPPTEREGPLVGAPESLEAQIKIPPWLQEIAMGEEGAPAPVPAEGPAEQVPEEPVSAPAEEEAEWPVEIEEEPFAEEPEVAAEEEIPQWLAELGVEPTVAEEAPAAPGVEEIPEWLAEPEVEAADREARPSAAPGKEPDWLASLRDHFAEEAEPPPGIGPREEVRPAEVRGEEAAEPEQMEGEEMPSGEEALAWLEQLTAEADVEARLSEITGGPEPAGVPSEEAAPEEVAAPPTEEAFGWAAFGEPEAEQVPTREEALAWLEQMAADREERRRSQAQTEMETRMREILGRPEPVEVSVEEAGPPEVAVEPAPVETVKPEIPEEGVEAPMEAEFAPVAAAEEVSGVTETEVREAVKEGAVPPEVSAVKEPAQFIASQRVYVEEHPGDHEAWLSLARALWEVDEREEAVDAYGQLIRAGESLKSVVSDLEKCQEQWPNAKVRRVLGDAYTKDGRLQEALDTYRHALEALQAQ